MSAAALCTAVRDTLRSALSLGTEPAKCDLCFEGYPHPMAGEVFYGIHPGEWRTASGDYDLGELMGVLVTITKKLGFSPQDRVAAAAWADATNGLDKLCRQAVKAIHRNQAVRAAANAIIGATDAIDGTPNGFVTELWFQGASRPELKTAEWFSAFSNTEPNPAWMGIAVTLNFGLAERVQGIAGMT